VAVSSIHPLSGIDELIGALDAHRARLDVAAARVRARRLGALADFVAEHGERGLRALGGRRQGRARARRAAHRGAGAGARAGARGARGPIAAVTSTVPLCSEAMRIAALYDADDALVSELLAPPPREECRAALEFWQARLAHLPRYRLSARREARVMATRWEARLRAAEEAALPAPVRWLRAGYAPRRGRGPRRCAGCTRGLGCFAARCWRRCSCSAPGSSPSGSW
jgi:hypothetical protein